MPAGSKADLSLAKAKSISDGGIIDLRRGGKNPCVAAIRGKEWEYVRGATLETPRLVKKKEEEVFQALKQRFSCSLWWRPGWDSCASAAHGGPWGSKYPPPAHGCPILEQSVPEGVHLVGGTYMGNSWRSAACGRDSHGRSLLRIVSCGIDPMLGQGTSEERLSSEWGRSSRDDMNWPQPPFAVPLRGDERENLGVKLSLRRGEVRGKCF